MNFRQFLEQESQNNLWNASKDDIIDYWKKLRSDIPIMVRPIPYHHSGTTYGEDGIRITGSSEFIGSVLPRLKDFLNFESPTSKLQLVYRQTKSPSLSIGPSKTSYAFYIQVKERGQNR